MYSEETKKKIEYQPAAWVIAALLVFLLAFCIGLRYIPEGAPKRMADINRAVLFGISDRDPVILLGYYLKKLFGISQAVSVCVLIPLCCYVLFIVLLWNVAGIFFAEDKKGKGLCFFAEACLVFLWDCGGSPAHAVLHGMCQTEAIVMTLAVPCVFLLGMRFCLSDKKSAWYFVTLRLLLLAVCLSVAFFYNRQALGLMLFGILSFVLLFIIRRYLPWLKASE